jgi:S-adenosylmethionine synthetase
MKKEFVDAVIEQIIKPCCPKEFLKNTKYLVNPTGRFVVGGPQGDCGLTGPQDHRRHVRRRVRPRRRAPSRARTRRRSTARRVRRALRRQERGRRGPRQAVPDPGELRHRRRAPDQRDRLHRGHGRIPDDKIAALIQQHFDLRPKGIVKMLDLLRPIYAKTAAYGHFGREEPEFSWERPDKVALLRDAAGLKGEAKRGARTPPTGVDHASKLRLITSATPGWPMSFWRSPEPAACSP